MRLLTYAAGILVLSGGLAWSDESAVPGAGWPAARYSVLWTKSPFAVATPDAAPESTAYTLWGIAQSDGVSYASLADKQQSNDHFLLSTDKPVRGLTLVSITRGTNGGDTLAVVQKDGAPITLKMEKAPAQVAANGAGPQTMGSPPPVIGPNSDVNASPPPTVRRRPPLVRMPPFTKEMPPQPPH